MKSFFGLPLKKGKLVRFIYLDEAGISDNGKEPHAVVAGVIVHVDDQLEKIRRHLSEIYNRHVLPKHRNRFVLHTKELFSGTSGEKVFSRDEYSLESRLNMADEIAASFEQLGLTLVLGVCDKAEKLARFPHLKNLRPKERATQFHGSAFIECAIMADGWMQLRAKNENAFLVVEDNEQARSTLKQASALMKQDIMTFQDGVGDISPLTSTIVEDPLFQGKKSENPLELADFAAYIARKRFMGDEKFDRVFEPMSKAIFITSRFYYQEHPA